MDGMDGRDGRTDGTDGTDGRTGRTDGWDGRTGRTGRTDETDGRDGRTDGRDGRTGRTDGTDGVESHSCFLEPRSEKTSIYEASYAFWSSFFLKIQIFGLAQPWLVAAGAFSQSVGFFLFGGIKKSYVLS